MAVSRENDRRIPMPMAIALAGLNQLLDLIGGQIFLGPQGPIGLPPWYFPLFALWRD
jgi:hypothetical protein